MKKILLLLVVLTCGVCYAQLNPHPAEASFSGNYGFMTVGNSNHMLKDVSAFPSNRDEELGIIKPLKNSGNIFGTGVTIENSNYRDFRISAPEEAICPGDITVERAFLSWGGRSFDSHRGEVLVQFRDRSQKLDQRTVTATPVIRDINNKNKGLYMCHADVTNFLNEALTHTTDSIYSIHVANLKTIDREFGIDGDSIGKFSGWTFTVIYSHPGLPERSLFYYQVDSLGDIKSTESPTTNPLFLTMDLTSVNSTITNGDDASIAISLFGAYSTDANEMFVGNPESVNNENLLRRRDPMLSHDEGGGNSFNNTVEYTYLFEDGNIESGSNTYTRGYDLHAFSFDASVGLSRDTTSFNMAITCESEVHFVSDVVLMFGEPNLPEVVLKDSSTKNVAPGQTMTYNLYVSLNNNTEKFQELEIAIPFSEYIESFEEIALTFPATDLSRNDGTRWVPDPNPESIFYLNTDGFSDVEIGNESTNWNAFTYNTQTPFLQTLNRMMQAADTVNYQRFLDDPTSIKQRVLKIKIDSIVNITNVRSDEAIVISFTMNTKKEGDWAYDKNSLKGKKTNYVPQSELTFTTPSGRESVVESIDKTDTFNWDDFICNQRVRGVGDGDGDGFLDFGGGGSGCGGEKSKYSDRTASQKGLYVKDPRHVEVNVEASANCPDVTFPDSITFSFCNTGLDVNTGVIVSLLKNRYDYDIQALRKRDSLTWIDVKQDSIYMMARRHGVNRSDVEGLIDFKRTSATTSHMYTTDTLMSLASCSDYRNLDMFGDSLDKVLNTPIDLSNVYLLFNEEGLTSTYENTERISVLENYTYQFTEKGKYYLQFYSPWNAGKCSDTIPLVIKDFTPEIPKVYYAGNEISYDTTIYICKEADIENIRIEKTNSVYDIYRSIEESGVVTKSDSAINVNADPYFNWNVNKDIDTKKSGDYDISLWFDDLGCVSEKFKFTISVTGVAIKEHPYMVLKDTATCMDPEGIKMIELSIVDTFNHTNFEPIWYLENQVDSSRSVFARGGDNILVPTDSAALYLYSVAFKSGQCISELRDTAAVNVLALPDTLASDTIYFCAGYEIKESDIRLWLGDKLLNSYDTIKYYKNPTDTEDQFVSLADLIAEKFFKTDCSNSSSDFVENPFFVRVKNSCYSAPSRMAVMARCFHTEAPKFVGGVDSVLYCLGDAVAPDLNVFNADKDSALFANGYRWQWIRSTATSLPEYDNRTNWYGNVASSYSSSLTGNDQGRELWSVVRIDSNNCVSDADTFQVIVDEKITTFPYVGDTTKAIMRNTDPLTITTCRNTPFYKSANIPTKPTVDDYTIEWFKKVDTVVAPKDSVFLKEILGKSDVAGMYQYKVRQSTKLGCKGQWLDVNLVVHPEVTEEPEFDRINLCFGEDEVNVVNKHTPSDAANLSLIYYSTKDSLKLSPLGSVSITSDSIGEFVDKQSLYIATYSNISTLCKGPFVNVEAIVSDLPHLPLLDNDTVNFCLGSEKYDLVAVTGSVENPLDNNTKLVWSAPTGVKVDKDGIATIVSAKKNIKYYVKQENELTGCVGKDTMVVVNIDKTFSFKRQKDTIRCYGESFDLLKSLNDSLRIKNDIIDAKVSFKVYKLTGASPSSSALSDVALSAIKSDAGRHEDQTKRFLVQYEDEIGGCSAKDTVTLLFKGLPSIMELSNIDTCFALPFNLPALDDKYEYQWYRNDLTTKITEKKVSLEESEKLYLIAENEFECKDTASIEVTVHKNPIESLVKDTVFCQNTGSKTIEMKIQGSDENEESKLITTLYDSEGNEVPRSINTDTVAVDGKRKVIDYYVVQKNLVTNCTSKTDFHVEVRKAFTLDAEDTKAVCEPDSVDFSKHVMLYLSDNESSIGIADLTKLNVKYARIDGNSKVDVDDAAASVLKHIVGRDTVNYIYTISDADNVCVASDTVAVTINFKPTTPKIADSQDTAFLCSDNVDLKLSAVDTNKDKTNTAVFWGEYRTGVQGNELSVVAYASEVKYTAFTKNLKSGCVSDYDTTFAVVADPVVVDVIDDADSKKCAGEKINVYDVLVNSFHFDPSIKRSFIKYEMTQNGVAASKSELSSVSRTVQDTILFEMTATDTLTGCTATNSVTVIFHDRPQNKIVAPTFACVGNTFEAKTVGEERKAKYSWQTKDEFELSSIASMKINSLAHDTTILLITNIEGTGCSDTLEHKVKVYATPNRLDAQEPFRFCQTDDDVKIEIARSAADVAAYKMEWTSTVDSVVVDPFVASAKKDTAYKLTVKQINITADTVCKSEPIIVDVEITKHISIALADTSICQPLDFDLAKYVQTKKTVSDDGFKPELTSVKFYDGGVTKPVVDSTSVTTPGLYEIGYTDKYGCPVLSSVKLAFISKPTKPVLDTDSIFNLCQSNDTVVTPVVVAGDYEFVWNNVGADRTFAAESLKIDASRPVDNVVYKVVRRDTIYGCESEPQSLTYSVKAPFSFDDLADIDICEYETINLDSLARTHLRPLDDLVLDIHNDGMNGNMSSINVEAVALAGVYAIDVVDTVSTCVASKNVKVNVHKKPAIKVTGNKPICEGNKLPLTAEGADYFYWNSAATPSTTFDVISTDDNDITVSLLARSVVAENNKTCEMDSSFVVKVHTTPSVLPSQDLFRFCQTDDDVNIELVRDAADAAAYSLEWTSAADSVVADKFVASARKDTAYELSVRQLNITSDTVCKSEPIKVKVEVTKAIKIALADTSICQPLVFDLAQYAQTKKKVSDEGFLPELTSVKIYDGGVTKPVADSTFVETPGLYEIGYTDKYGCPISTKMKLAFISKPTKPVLDTDSIFNLCQSNDTVVTPVVVAGDYEFVWNNVGADRTFAAESLKIDASRPVDNVVYKVVRRDTIYGCESEPQSLTYSVKSPFSFDDLADVDICEYETINLDSLARKHLRPLDDLVLDIHNDGMNGNMSSINVEAVALAGVYAIDVVNTVSTCVASKNVNVNVHKKPAIKVTGNKPICEGNKLPLAAEGADYFYWNSAATPSATFDVISTDDNDITVSLLARSVVAENNKTCEMDSSFVVKVHTTPSVLQSQDLFRFCQTDDDVNIELVRDAADAAAYSLEWTSAADSVVADKFVASARKDTAYELSVRQLNITSDTVCKSEPIKVKVEVTKAIKIALADTAICMPLDFDLAQYAQTKKKTSEEGFLPKLTSVKLYEGGVEKGVADSTKVNVAGNYKLVYTDRFNCPIVASTNLKFIKKPETPILDVNPSFNLCVGVEITVHADIVAGDYKTSWTMVGNGAKSVGDTLALDVAKAITDGYDVMRIDTVYGCESEKTHFDYNVIELFKLAVNRNIDICEYETIDLDSVSRAMYSDPDLKLEIVPTMTLDATMPFVASKASAEGVYLLKVVHQISNCEAQSEIKVNNYKKPEITVIGNKPICEGDTLLLKVDGGDFYYWNNSTVSTDSAFVPGLEDGETLVNLSVSKLVGTTGKTCKADSVVKVIVETVPDLITSKLDTAYCQDGKTSSLYLIPTDNNAKVVWYSPEDDYQTSRPNASFAPSATDAGEFTFKFKQILGNCSTKLQNYVVTIEDKITEIPVVNDTAYCVGETPVELIANWKDYACDVKWTDKNSNNVDILPSTVVAGQTQYCARLTRGACIGNPACMTVYVKDRFNTIADIQDTFRFCAGTGVHRLEPNTTIPGVRLNWYNIHDVKRADIAEFDADGNQNNDTYFVTQSEINGCESDSVKVEVVKVPAVREQTFFVDTCKGVSLKASDVMAENKIDYEMKSLAKVASDGHDSIIPLGGNIGFNGTYNLTVQTEYGCVGVEKINVTMIEPEHLIWPKDGFTSCPGDTVKINAGSSNSWFKVLDSDGESELAYLYGVNESYSFVADEYKQFEILAMVKGHESCVAKKTLSYDVYSPEKPVVYGTPGVCKGDELKLIVENIEKNFSWNYDGEVLSTTDEFKYTPEKSGYLRVSGTDKNGCNVADTLAIKVVDILTPEIELIPRISSTQYHINRDTTEVEFLAKLNTADDSMFTYSWNFGDGSALGMEKNEIHVYADTVVKLSRLVNVGLTVTHEFGCVGTAYTTLYIDPSIDVPNTFVLGTDNVFMEDYDLEIFDRVGNLIHKGPGWDGTYDKNGEYVFHDTYFYSLTYYVGGEEKHKTGYITVVR